jgi:hypothetical protein
VVCSEQVALNLWKHFIANSTFNTNVFFMQVAPLLPPLTHPWLAAIQQDQYYRLVIPLSVPVTIVAIGLNWFSLKLFKHNS